MITALSDDLARDTRNTRNGWDQYVPALITRCDPNPPPPQSPQGPGPIGFAARRRLTYLGPRS